MSDKPLAALTEEDAFRVAIYTWDMSKDSRNKRERYDAAIASLPYKPYTPAYVSACGLCDFAARLQHIHSERGLPTCLYCPMYTHWDYDAQVDEKAQYCVTAGTPFRYWEKTEVGSYEGLRYARKVHDNILRVFKEKYPNESHELPE